MRNFFMGDDFTDKEKFEKYEAKRKEIHKRYSKVKLKLWIIALVIMAVLTVAAYLVFIPFDLLPGSTPLFIVAEFLFIGGTLAVTFNREKAYIYSEREQLRLLEQDEPFSHFGC